MINMRQQGFWFLRPASHHAIGTQQLFKRQTEEKLKISKLLEDLFHFFPDTFITSASITHLHVSPEACH